MNGSQVLRRRRIEIYSAIAQRAKPRDATSRNSFVPLCYSGSYFESIPHDTLDLYPFRGLDKDRFELWVRRFERIKSGSR